MRSFLFHAVLTACILGAVSVSVDTDNSAESEVNTESDDAMSTSEDTSVATSDPVQNLRGAVMALAYSPDDMKKMSTTDILVNTLVSFAIWLVLFLICAAIYSRTMAIPELDMDRLRQSNLLASDGFKYHCCAWYQTPMLSLCACFVPGVPWADTMGAVRIMSYGMSLGIWILITALSMLTGGISWILLAGLFAYFRQQMRKKLDMQNEGMDCFCDYCLWLWCPCCTIVQEARQAFEVPVKALGRPLV